MKLAWQRWTRKATLPARGMENFAVLGKNDRVDNAAAHDFSAQYRTFEHGPALAPPFANAKPF